VKTVQEALETLVREIGAYKGLALDRAVHGVTGAVAVLVSMKLLSMDEASEWRAKARKAGIDKRAQEGRKTMHRKVVDMLPEREAAYVNRLEVLHRLVKSRIDAKEIKDPGFVDVLNSLEKFDLYA